MADKASAAGVAAAIRPPDYRKAVISIRGIKAKKEAIAGKNSEIGDIWAKIEGMKVHKKAGKMFAQLDALEGPERADIIRSFNGLADASGWDKEYADLADKAGGTVVDMRLEGSGDEAPGAEAGGEAEPDEDPDADPDADVDEDPDADPPEAQSRIGKALAKSRRHLGSEPKVAGATKH